MAGAMQLALLLVIAVFARSDAAPLIDEQSRSSALSVEHIVNLDKTFDRLTPDLQTFIKKNAMDPIDIIDISESLLPDMPGNLKGHVELKNGWLQNLSKVKRADHVIGKYTDGEHKLTLDMGLGFDVIDFNYEYNVQYLLLKRKGDIYGRFFDLKTKVLVTMDLNTRRITLHSIKFSGVGKYNIKFEGHILDPILNAATKIITTIFKKYVLAHIEDRALYIFRAKIDEWNKTYAKNVTVEEIEQIRDIDTLDFNTLDIDTFDIKLKTLDLFSVDL